MFRHSVDAGLVMSNYDPAPDDVGGLFSVDFTPDFIHIHEDELDSICGTWARFGTIIERANRYLMRHPYLSVKSCETIQFRTELNQLRKPDKSDFRQRGESSDGFVKALRMWVTRDTRTSANLMPDQIGYLNFAPVFDEDGLANPSTLAGLIDRVNERLICDPIAGRMVAAETLRFRGLHRKQFDPDLTSWSPDSSFFSSMQKFITAIRVWFVKGMPQYETIRFAEFYPTILDEGDEFERARVELLPGVLLRVEQWLNQLPTNVSILNINTLSLRSSKYGDHDSNHLTFEEDVESHKYYLKFLRISYVEKTLEIADPPAYESRRLTTQLFNPGVVMSSGVFSESGIFEAQSVVKSRLDQWVLQTSAKVIAVGTVIYQAETFHGFGGFGGESRDGFCAMFTGNKESYGHQRKHHIPIGEKYLICFRLYLDGVVVDPVGFSWPNTAYLDSEEDESPDDDFGRSRGNKIEDTCNIV